MFKTFLYWALDNGHTYKVDFQKFKAPKAAQTDEVALTFEQVNEVFSFDLSKNPKLERIRDLFPTDASFQSVRFCYDRL